MSEPKQVGTEIVIALRCALPSTEVVARGDIERARAQRTCQSTKALIGSLRSWFQHNVLESSDDAVKKH